MLLWTGGAQHGLMFKTGTVVSAPLSAAPSSTKNESGQRDPVIHQMQKGKQWHLGLMAYIRVDTQSGLVHAVVGTAAHVNDMTQAHALLHRQSPRSAWRERGGHVDGALQAAERA